MYGAVQGDGALLAGSYRVDGELRAGIAVAADEDVGLGGLIGEAVGHGKALLCDLELADVEPAPIDDLTYGADDAVDLDNFEFAGADGLAAALLIGLAKLHELDLEPRDLAVCTFDLDGSAQEAELDALGHCLLDLLGVCGHLGLGAAVDYVGVLRAKADGAAAYVHRNVAAADNGAFFTDLGLVAEVYLTQEVNAAEHALELLARNAERSGLLSADSQIEALIALLSELLYGNVFADLDAALEFNAHLTKNVDLGVQDVLFKAEGGDTKREHTAGDGVFIENGDRVTLVRKIVCAAHAGGARAYDGDLLGVGAAGLVYHLGNVAGLFVQVVVGDKALDLVNGDSLVNACAGAFGLAALVADSAAYGGEGVLCLY